PDRYDVPLSNGAPMMTMSAPSYDAGSSRSHRGTPRKVTSGPNMAIASAHIQHGVSSRSASGDDHARDRDQDPSDENQRAHHVDLRRDTEPGGAEDPQRERHGLAGVELGDDEVVDRQCERQ